MTTHEERQRLAAMGNVLRPEWNIRSLYTLLTDDEVLVKRAYRDVARAAADCWTDPDTKTPKRLSEPGLWWGTPAAGQRPTGVTADTAARCERCGVVHTRLSPCAAPESERSRGRGAELARQALRGDGDA